MYTYTHTYIQKSKIIAVSGSPIHERLPCDKVCLQSNILVLLINLTLLCIIQSKEYQGTLI